MLGDMVVVLAPTLDRSSAEDVHKLVQRVGARNLDLLIVGHKIGVLLFELRHVACIGHS